MSISEIVDLCWYDSYTWSWLPAEIQEIVVQTTGQRVTTAYAAAIALRDRRESCNA